MNTRVCVAAYLAAVVLANLAAARFGVWVTPVIGFFAIGLDLTMRDLLHEQWQGRLRRNMGLLIVSGSVLAALLNPAATRVALGSALAFGLGATVDTIVYARLKRDGWPRMACVNFSNVVSGLVDSLVFPAVAFGGVFPGVVLTQWAAKVVGGMVWVVIINKATRKQV